MRKIYFLFILLILTSSAGAQLLPPDQPEQDACNALLLCGNTFTSTYSYQQEGQVNDLSSTPCGNGEGNSMWLRLEITSPGIIVFTITPLNGTDDYDFAIVDITNSSCSTFTSSDVIRCNFNNNQPGSNPGGIVGLNTTSTSLFTNSGAFGGSFLQQINANAGDVYLIMINNFGDPFAGGPSAGFTIDFTGSTAIFNDNGRPYMAGVDQRCGNQLQLFIPMSEAILCSSIDPSGDDFVLSGGGVIASATGVNCNGSIGYTDTVVLNLASQLPAGNYSLSIQNGTDGNTLIDLCGHQDTIPDVLQFTVNGANLNYKEIIPPSCYEFRIVTTGKANCNSIAVNGTDFSISGPQPVTVVSALPISCDASNLTDTILLRLSTPLITDGTYTITSQNGSDGNTLVDNCGLMQPVGDAINFTINSNDGLVTAMPDMVICNPDYINLTATDNSAQPSTYLWSPGTFVQDSTSLQTIAYISQTTPFTILAIDKDGCPHRAYTTVTLSERNPILTPLESTICYGEEVQLYATGGETYSWANADMSSMSCSDCPSPIVVPMQTTIYTVNIVDSNNCVDTSYSAITVNPLPIITAAPNDTTVKYGTDLQLTASGATIYTWSPAQQLNYSNSPAPIATITDPATFIVTGFDITGCKNTDSIKVLVDYDANIGLPTAFSPNGDGKNDIFRLVGAGFERLQEFRIFNRWGQELFHTNNIRDGCSKL